MKQSSIDWLAEKLRQKLTIETNIHGHDSVTFGMKKMLEYMEEQLQTAREMHRQEIEEAHRRGMFSEGFENGKEYYTETFKQP